MIDDNDNDNAGMETDDRRLISRRTVAKGLAWSVPVLIAAPAMPVAAATLPPCTPSTANTNVAWSVTSSWPRSNSRDCGAHTDVVFLFKSTCVDGTKVEIVVGPLPGSNDTSDRGAIWQWNTTNPVPRGAYGYLLDPASPARTAAQEGGLPGGLGAGEIAVPKYRSQGGLGWRLTYGGVDDGIHVARHNIVSSRCQAVTTTTFKWFWRTYSPPTYGPWHEMQSVLKHSDDSLTTSFVAMANPGSYTKIDY